MTPDMDAVLGGLKDFQRATVDYAFKRLFSPEGTGRFLVADEVGLGKTLVARGIIARTIEHLRSRQERVSIVYVCSNGDIARQNIKRLRIPGVPDAARATRVTLLATELGEMGRNPINLIALTPGTSFEQSRGGGRYDERVVLYALLDSAWDIRGRMAALHVLRNYAGAQSFGAAVETFDPDSINAEIKQRFLGALQGAIAKDRALGRTDLKRRFEALCQAYPRSNSQPGPEAAAERDRWIGAMRELLAHECLGALQPDLIILDEFQRFGHLLRDSEETPELARAFLHEPARRARILLLSATPYRPLSLHHEGNDDHYQDFLSVVRFLENGNAAGLEGILEEHRKALEGLPAAPDAREDLRRAVAALETRLRGIMARTEHDTLGDGKAMLREVVGRDCRPAASDIEAFLGVQKIAEAVGEGDVIEYWKSAPYLLNFMDNGYALKKGFEKQAHEHALIELVRKNKRCFIDEEQLENYRQVDASNGRLRGLADEMTGSGLWRLLWLPPSLPYHELGGVFAAPELRNATKRLVFSAWHVVPRAAASLISYEAERAMMREGKPRGALTQEDRTRHRGLLRFNVSAGRAAGLPALLHVYPSMVFARDCDPRGLAREGTKSAADVAETAAHKIGERLRRLTIPAVADGPADIRWYWLAPMLLDAAEFPDASSAWWDRDELAQLWSIGKHVDEADLEDDTGWPAHVDEARRLVASVVAGESDLGRQPEDLVQVLAVAALASPATASLRALTRIIGTGQPPGLTVRDAAGRMGHGFRSLFNHPEVVHLLRAGKTDDAYWLTVLNYAHDGCLQAVLDEYLHLLHEAADGANGDVSEPAEELANAVIDALTIRTANLSVDMIAAPRFTRSVRIEGHRMRNRFAMRFGDQHNDEDQAGPDARGIARKERVRAAFNSPFWPFVLVSTSVGQEGLDFHHYCHAVTHWNLPSNPVDLEQREGRVHRYKGHAVRKNVARAFGGEALSASTGDIWREMFDRARRQRPAGRSDLEPYWVFEGEAKIERHVPIVPFSREEERLHELRRALAIYRMVFGQSRQEDLIAYLLREIPDGDRDSIVNELRINLSPLTAVDASMACLPNELAAE